MAKSEAVIVSHSIQLRNDSSECRRLYAFLADSLAALPVTEEQHHDLKLVAEEILSNIIRHGYESSQHAEVLIELNATTSSISLSFTDTGKPFNPINTANLSNDDDLSEGGMGIHLVKSLTDEQCYERNGDTNVFTVTKHYN